MMREMIGIGKRTIGPGSPCLVVAELGTSHQGDLSTALRLIEAAVRAGADCVKFQLVHADEILHPRSGTVDLPGGRVALYEQFKKLEMRIEFYAALKEATEAAGALFLCSPFGIRSARQLRGLGVKVLKIASPELNHFPLLAEAASYGIPLILSSGVSTLGDIERALAITGTDATVLLHCITAYPAPEEQYNVRVLESLSAVLGLPVGISDHSLDPALVPALAVSCGACIVEKHFTLSRAGDGLDDPIALEPEAFHEMVCAIRDAEEAGPAATREKLSRTHGAARVAAVLGTGVKRLADAERANYQRTNRSLHAVHDIPAGAVICAADVAILRTEKVLHPGLEPGLLPRVLGARTRRPIPEGEGITWEDLA
jgi:sialic acid synthase SpsE